MKLPQMKSEHKCIIDMMDFSVRQLDVQLMKAMDNNKNTNTTVHIVLW